MIRGIIFDCFGVLYHGSLDYLRDLAPPDQVSDVTNLSHSYDYGYITQADYFAGVGEVVGKSADEIEQICKEQHVRNEKLINYVRTLKPTYKTALLSNVGHGFVESLFTPAELKPNAGIYQLTAEKLNLRPEECVMIDDIDRNIEGAWAVGMQGITYQNFDQMVTDLNVLLGGTDA